MMPTPPPLDDTRLRDDCGGDLGAEATVIKPTTGMCQYTNSFIAELTDRVRAFSDKPAFIEPIFNDSDIVDERVITYDLLLNHAHQIAESLEQRRTRGTIGLRMSNHYLFIPAFLGILSANAIAVPIDFKDDAAIKNAVEKTHLDTILVRSTGNIKQSGITLIDISALPLSNRMPRSNEHRTNHATGLEDTIILSPTSGTSSKSKYVQITNQNVLATAERYRDAYNLGINDKILLALPLFHNYGMFANLTSGLLNGATFFPLAQWDQKTARSIIKRYGISVFSGAPHMYMDLVNRQATKEELHSINVCDVGGTYMPVQYMRLFEERIGATMTEGYGLTETTSFTHFNDDPKRRVLGSIGRPLRGVSCKIVDETGKDVEEGDYGILLIKGDMVAKGYINDAVATANAFLDDGWFSTGDVVRRDENNYYYLAGRLSDIKSAKLPLFPRMVEETIYENPNIAECAVRTEYNETAQFHTYTIYLKPNSPIDLELLSQELKQKYQGIVIKDISIVDSFDKTTTNKIRKARL